MRQGPVVITSKDAPAHNNTVHQNPNPEQRILPNEPEDLPRKFRTRREEEIYALPESGRLTFREQSFRRRQFRRMLRRSDRARLCFSALSTSPRRGSAGCFWNFRWY